MPFNQICNDPAGEHGALDVSFAQTVIALADKYSAPHTAFLCVSLLSAYAATEPHVVFAIAAAHGHLPLARLAVSLFGRDGFTSKKNSSSGLADSWTTTGRCQSLYVLGPDLFDKIPPVALRKFFKVQNLCMRPVDGRPNSYTAKNRWPELAHQIVIT